MRYTFVASIVFFASSIVNTGVSTTTNLPTQDKDNADDTESADIFEFFGHHLNLEQPRPDDEFHESFYDNEYADEDVEEDEENYDEAEIEENKGRGDETPDFLTGDDPLPTPTDSHIIIPVTASESEFPKFEDTSDAKTTDSSAQAKTSNTSDISAEAETSNESSEIAHPAIDSDLVRSTVISFLV